MGKYTDYVMKTAQDLLAVPSPSGFTHMAAEFVKKEFENLIIYRSSLFVWQCASQKLLLSDNIIFTYYPQM